MDYDSFLELVQKRRTVRRFKPDPVPDIYLEKIVEAARWAPSGYNTQPWDFIIVKDKKLRDLITRSFDLHKALIARSEAAGASEQRMRQISQPWLDEEMDFHAAPVLIVLLSDNRAKAGLPDMGKVDPTGTRSTFLKSLAIAFVYMELAATTLGLGSQWVGGIPVAFNTLKQILGIPDRLEPFATLAVGYPAYEPRPKLLRPKEKMVHYDDCGKTDFRTDEEVSEFAERTWTWATAAHRRGVDK